MELSDEIYSRVTRLSKTGNELMEEGRHTEAIDAFETALHLLPEPKGAWDAAMWLYASIGDAQFKLRHFKEAKAALFDAMNVAGGATNPFVLLRAGETLHELGEKDTAREYLLRAYMLEGVELFEDEADRPYLAILKQSKLIP
jgi:tetratricopeptide (TPR) repeat protein